VIDSKNICCIERYEAINNISFYWERERKQQRKRKKEREIERRE
jgi:hypothetical protein